MVTLFDNIRNKLPSIRRPERDSSYRLFENQYGFVFLNGEKSTGDYDRYYMAYNNPYVYRCIQSISDSLLTQGFEIKPKNEEETIDNLTVDYLTNLFNNPNGLYENTTFAIFNNLIVKNFELTGDCFIEIDTDKELGIIDGFQVIPMGLLKWFPDTEQYGYRDKPELRYENDELIHIYEPSIFFSHSKFGDSKIDKIVNIIQLMLSGLDYNQEILNNNGLSPSSFISFDKDMEDLDFRAELKRLNEMSKQRRKGGTLAIKGGMFQSMGASNVDLDYLNLINMCRDTILSVYGVPPAKAGIIETANLGSGSGNSQDKTFKDMINGQSRIIEDAFNKALGRNGFKEVFRYGELDIEDKLQRTQIEANKLQSKVLTVNEVRAGYNLPPVDWGYKPNENNNQNNGPGGGPDETETSKNIGKSDYGFEVKKPETSHGKHHHFDKSYYGNAPRLYLNSLEEVGLIERKND